VIIAILIDNLYPAGYNANVIEISKTAHFAKWQVYYIRHERSVIILLAGGDKSTQARDIKTALRLARNL